MGCVSSKKIESTAIQVYRPPPSSFAVFDITTVEEPWLKNDAVEPLPEKVSHVPAPILDKLNDSEQAPRTWDEVSKELEDLKPNFNKVLALPAAPTPENVATGNYSPAPRLKRKSFSFHTLDELERRTLANSGNNPSGSESTKSELKRAQSTKTGAPPKSSNGAASRNGVAPPVAKSIKDNIFILKDRQEREKEGKSSGFVKRDPLSDFEENPPPNGEDKVVVYTTSLGGVRRTYEDCNKVRQLMETHLVAYDERDVSRHGGFLNELKGLLGEGVSVPRVFVKGRYVGGVDEVVDLNEKGRLSRILNWAKVERGLGRLGCEGCGGLRFVPCLECGGSCKIVGVGGKEKQRCEECNENGLVHCPLCAEL